MSGCSGLHLTYILDVSTQALSQVDTAVVAKRVDRHAGKRVHFLEVAVNGENNPPVGPVLALPVIESPISRCTFQRMRPDLFPSGRVEGHDRRAASHHVHNALHDQRAECESAARPWRLVSPCQLKLAYTTL